MKLERLFPSFPKAYHQILSPPSQPPAPAAVSEGISTQGFAARILLTLWSWILSSVFWNLIMC